MHWGTTQRGIPCRRLGRTEEALAAFTRATELRPDFAESHFKLGLTLRKLGRTDEAVGPIPAPLNCPRTSRRVQ